MLRVPITFARPGMRLAMPLRNPERPDQVLLQAGYEIDDMALSRLREMPVAELWIRYPGLDFVSRYINPRILDGQAAVASAVRDIFERMERDGHARLEYPAYRSLIRDFIDKLVEDPHAAVFVQDLAAGERPHLRHCANVCFRSLLMGLRLDGYLITQRRRLPAIRAKNVVNLGVGALLHDIGMTRLDPDVVERWIATYDESDPRFRAHARIGFGLVKRHIEPSAAAAVLHHHQRFDGRGFPSLPDDTGGMCPPAGERIHVFARIIAAADHFERLRNPPGARRTVPIVEALRLAQREENARRVDPMALKALIAVTPPYPPGGIVTLSNGEQCVVTDWRAEDPCRPVVRTISDLGNEDWRWNRDEQVYDLAKRPDLHVSIAEGQDVSRSNFHPARPGDFVIGGAERGMAAA